MRTIAVAAVLVLVSLTAALLTAAATESKSLRYSDTGCTLW